MDIEITHTKLTAMATCSRCDGFESVEVDDGDAYFSEEHMLEAVADAFDPEWDTEEGLCPECVYDRDNPEEEDN